MTGRRARGHLEAAVLDAVAQADRPVTVAEVAELLEDSPAYTTVMTTLTRLREKGALVRAPQGRGFAYALAAGVDVLPAARTARRMRRLLEAEGQRADVLARFVAELDPGDEELLLTLLREAERGDTDAGPA